MPRKSRDITGDARRARRRQQQRERRMRLREEERLHNKATQTRGIQENEEEREERVMIPWNHPLLSPISGIQSTLLPCKTVNQMTVRMNNAEAKGPPDQPMKYYLNYNQVPAFPRAVQVSNSNDVKASKDQPHEVLPECAKELKGCKPIQGNYAILHQPYVEIPAGRATYPVLLLQSVNETGSNLNSNINLVNGYSNFTKCNIVNGSVINIRPAFHINANASQFQDKLNIVMLDKNPQAVCNSTLVMNGEVCKTAENASDSSAKVCGITIKSEVIDDNEESTNDCIVNSGIKRTFDSVSDSVIKKDDQENFTKIKIKKENDDEIGSTFESVCNVSASPSNVYIKQEFIDDSDKSTEVTYLMNDESTKISKFVSDFSTSECNISIKSEAIDVSAALSTQDASNITCTMNSVIKKSTNNLIKSNALQVAHYTKN